MSDTTSTTEPTTTEPAAQVIPFEPPAYTCSQFIDKDGLREKNKHIAFAFEHEVKLADQHTTVKRTRAEWRKMFNDWLTKPRY